MKIFFVFFKVSILFFFLAHSCPTTAFGEEKKPNTRSSYSPPAITLENPVYTFETSFTGLAMQPFANNLDYAAEALPFSYGNSQPAISPNWVIPVISTDFHFGFDVEVAGVFHNTCSNLVLNWERYHSSSDSSSITADSINDMVGTFFEIGPDASFYKKGMGKVRFHLDEVNLNYGTFVDFGSFVSINLLAGVGFNRLVQYRFSTISNFSDTIVRTLDVPSKFTGAGPQLALEFNVKIVKGFQFVGGTRASLFIGTFKNSTTFTTTSPELMALGDEDPNVQTTTVYNKNGIVPGFEGKLGLAYESVFRQHYMLKIEAGYQAQVYINSIRSVDMGSEVALGAIGSVGSSTVGVYARTFQRTVSDFGLAGPYVALNLAF